MTDWREKKAADGSPDSRTIRIEMPDGIFDQMCKMMSRSGQSAASNSGCCGMNAETCCPQPGDGENQEVTIVIKRKG